jgi:acyl-CoA reductase-like NAD-dependent aldehyde dehydrogenase
MKYQDKLGQIQRKLYINGEYVASKEGKSFPIISPSTESVIG